MNTSHRPLLLVLLAAAGAFAVTMGARQSMGLFVGDINTTTGLGLVGVSLAFAFGQLWWGLTQPLAGIVADRWGPGRVIVAGVLLVALGTALIPLMRSTWGLTLAIGVLAAGGAGLAGPSVLMAATTRLVPPVLVGRDSAVGPGAWVSASSIGAGCTVGYGARVTRSVLHDGAVVGRAADVADCVLGHDVEVGEATTVRDELRIRETP